MTYEKFRAELIAAGLTLRAFAELLKLNPNSVTNYKALGEVPDHIAVIAALIHDLVNRGGNVFRAAVKTCACAPKSGARKKHRLVVARQDELIALAEVTHLRGL